MSSKETFSYCIGYPWSPGSTDINTYAYGVHVFHGNMTDAKTMLDFIQDRADDGKERKIYKLVEV